MFGHPHIDRWSLLMHRHIAERIERGDLEPLDIARRNLARWRELHGELMPAQVEWIAVLDGSLPALLRILRDGDDQDAVRMRSNSPFAGAVDQKLRIELLHEARAA